MEQTVRKVARVTKPQQELDLAEITSEVQSYSTLTTRITELTAMRDSVKKRLSGIVEQWGQPDDKGHMVLPLTDVVGGYKSLVRQRRSKRGLDVERAEELLRAKGLYERCYEMVPVLNEDAVMAAHFEGLITQADLDTIFPETVTYAFAPAKAE